MKLTLDWNCVIAVAKKEPQASSVIDLVQAHRSGEFEVALLAASASESTKSKTFPKNANVFKQRIRQLGWDDLPLVPMPSVIGLSYVDFGFTIGDGEAFKRDTDALWDVMGRNVPKNSLDHITDGQTLNDDVIQSKALKKWRNTWCDVVSAYSHIHAERDIFVTNNIRDFQENATSLAALGMKNISTPAEARNLAKNLLKTVSQ